MGLAIIKGLIESNPELDLHIVERDVGRRNALLGEHHLPTHESLQLIAGDAVVLAIPPQAFATFAELERDKFPPDTPVISVMAGVRAATISEALNSNQVVRTIPNTPAEVRRGLTVYYAPATVTPDTLKLTQVILSSIGTSLRVGEEGMIDPATAICGGGPAFVSYFADAFCTFAVDHGFTDDEAIRLITETFQGTAELIRTSRRSPDALCREVMTPNGTTERGIAAFDSGRLKPLVIAALSASTGRSRELSDLDT